MGNHERIYIAQATEMLIVPFYALWLSDFCCRLARNKGGAKEAYRIIRLEQEAFDHEHDMSYLQARAASCSHGDTIQGVRLLSARRRRRSPKRRWTYTQGMRR